jgi:hypothetical protein
VDGEAKAGYMVVMDIMLNLEAVAAVVVTM